jgi:hypothetical protein
VQHSARRGYVQYVQRDSSSSCKAVNTTHVLQYTNPMRAVAVTFAANRCAAMRVCESAIVHIARLLLSKRLYMCRSVARAHTVAHATAAPLLLQ